MQIIDLYTTISFIKRIVTPFKQWKAYKLGIIDEKGAQLKQKKDLKSIEEKDAFGYLDILALNLKKLLAKVPGGATTLGTYAAALLLLKEYPKVQKEDESLMQDLPALLEETLEESRAFLSEDAPVNAVSGGQIAGANGDPPVSQKSKYKRKNEEQTRQMLQGVQAVLVRRKP